MGYEVKMYVVEPSKSAHKAPVFIDCDGVGRFMFEDSDGKYHHGLDGNTKTYIDEGCEDQVIYQFSARVVAMVDVCKPGYDSHLFKISRKESEYMIFREDGNTVHGEDDYGDRLEQADLKDVIRALKTDLNEGAYRRFKTALALLQACEEDYDDVKVIFYGY